MHIQEGERVATGGKCKICKRNREKKKIAKTRKINFKLKAIISTITMSSIVTLAQFECMNRMIK